MAKVRLGDLVNRIEGLNQLSWLVANPRATAFILDETAQRLGHERPFPRHFFWSFVGTSIGGSQGRARLTRQTGLLTFGSGALQFGGLLDPGATLEPLMVVAAERTIRMICDVSKSVEVRVRFHFYSGGDSMRCLRAFGHHLGHDRLHSTRRLATCEVCAKRRRMALICLNGPRRV